MNSSEKPTMNTWWSTLFTTLIGPFTLEEAADFWHLKCRCCGIEWATSYQQRAQYWKTLPCFIAIAIAPWIAAAWCQGPLNGGLLIAGTCGVLNLAFSIRWCYNADRALYEFQRGKDERREQDRARRQSEQPQKTALAKQRVIDLYATNKELIQHDISPKEYQARMRVILTNGDIEYMEWDLSALADWIEASARYARMRSLFRKHERVIGDIYTEDMFEEDLARMGSSDSWNYDIKPEKRWSQCIEERILSLVETRRAAAGNAKETDGIEAEMEAEIQRAREEANRKGYSESVLEAEIDVIRNRYKKAECVS